MKMQTLVKKTNEGFDPSSADIAKELVAKHGKNVTKDHIRALEQDRDSNKGLDHDDIMKHVKKLQEETERERLMKLRSFAYKQKVKGLGADVHEPVSEEAEQIDELKKSTLASYAKKATDDVSYHSFMAGTMSSKDPERLVQDKKAMKRQAGVIKAVDKMAKEEVEQVDEVRYQVVGKTRENETFKSKIHPTKREAQGTHYKMAKSGHYKEINLVKVSEETEQLDELSPEARKNKMRTMGVNAAIQHPKKVDFAGGAIQMYRQAVKKLSSKEMGGVAKKLPSVKEENDGTEADQGEYGYEGDMAMSQLKSIIRNAKGLHDLLEPQTDLPEWVQSKITLAADYIQTAADYWRSEKEEAMTEGKMKDIATSKAEAERILGGPVKPKASAVGGKGQPKNLRNLVSRLATKAMKAGHSVTEEEKKSGKVPRIGPMEKALEEEEVWDKPMPDSKKQGSLSPEQKAKAKARADRAGRSYPNMVDNMWASKQ
jgi:hypothetical protein